MIADPTIELSVDANTLTSTEASYLSSMQEGVDLMYLCRMPECLYFGLNSQWVKHVTKEQFKCPCCGEQYKPSSTYKGAVDAGFVLSIVHPNTGQQQLIPVTWPPSNDIEY